MFGHVRGSFKDASPIEGLFEQANRGRSSSDEVGELRPEHQSKLLRVLQDKASTGSARRGRPPSTSGWSRQQSRPRAGQLPRVWFR